MGTLPQLLRRSQARDALGVGEYVFAKMVECGTVKSVYLQKDPKTGKGKGRAFFKRKDIEALI